MLESAVTYKKKWNRCYHFRVFTEESQVLLLVIVGSDDNGTVLLSALKLSKTTFSPVNSERGDHC